MTNQNQIAVKNVLDGWRGRVLEANKMLSQITDEKLLEEIAPGKNRGIYLLGHLVAVHDLMLPLLNFGEAQFPSLREQFITNPDKAVAEIPSVQELRENWATVNDALANHYANLTVDEWFVKHSSISAEGFEKEPHRNRLSIVVSRTSHLAYHVGQLSLLK